MNTRVARILVSFIGLFLITACSSPARNETSPADISEVRLGSLQPPPLRVRVTAYGVLANSCERLGGVTQRLEGRTFFIDIAKLSPSESAECAAVITEFREEVVLELEGLADGVYTVDVNGVTKTFTLPLVEWTTYKADILSVAVALLESDPVQIIVTAEGNLTNGCDEPGDITQRRDEDTFFITILGLAPVLPDDVACTPAGANSEQVTLETQNLAPGTYKATVNGVVKTFTLP